MKIGDYVYFWRDKSRWLGPARVVEISDHVVTLVHDEQTKTSSLNRVQQTFPPLEDIVLDDEDAATAPEPSQSVPLTPVDILRRSDVEGDDEDGPWRVGWKRVTTSSGMICPTLRTTRTS